MTPHSRPFGSRLMGAVAAVLLALAACAPAADVGTTASTAATAPTTPSPQITGSTEAGDVDHATLVFTGGTVLTMDRVGRVAEAVAVKDNLIVAVGSKAEIEALIGPRTLVVNLAEQILLPGFVDGHAHYYTAPDALGLDHIGIQDHMLSVGVTTAAEMTVTPDLLAELSRLDDEGEIRVRTSLYLAHNTSCGELLDPWILDVRPTRGWGERLRIGGVKVFNDGGSCNVPASSYERPNGGRGDLYMTAGEITDVVTLYDQAGYQVALHALGDRAIKEVLDGLEAVIGDSGNPRRHRIEHNTSLPPEMRDRYDEVGAVAMTFGSLNTCFLLGQDDRFRFSMPVEYQEWEWPWRDLLDLNPGTVFAWHGDFPVFEDSTPIGNLAGYVTRRQVRPDGTMCEPEPYHAKHAITAGEALWMMTAGSAFALDRDSEVGSIEVGKLADLVLLSEDPRAVSADDLFGLSVELTVLDGEIVHCGSTRADLCDGPPLIVSSTTTTTEPSFTPLTFSASSSLTTNPPELAGDGDLDSHWSSGSSAPQWIELALESETVVTGLRLLVSQFPEGFTRHVVLGRLAGGDLVRLAELADVTAERDLLTVSFSEPRAIVGVRIETVESPSWVAWFEIEVIAES